MKRRPCAKCKVPRQEKFFRTPRTRVCDDCKRKGRQSLSRNRRLTETYGITEQEYLVLLEAQGGVCAICEGKRRGSLDVDHDHKTGMVRGLLCRRCNRRLLPSAQDSTDRLESAIKYLRYPPAQRELGPRYVPTTATKSA